MKKLDFKKWHEMVGAGAVYDPKAKSRDWNWWGAVGSSGVSPKEEPIHKKKKKKKK